MITKVMYRDPFYNEYFGSVVYEKAFHYVIKITNIVPSGKLGSILLENSKIGDEILVAKSICVIE